VVRTLEELPGVKNAYANYPEKRAVVTYDQASVTTEQMCRVLLKAGYVASPTINNKGAHTVSPDESCNRTDHRISDFICYCFEYTKHDIEQDFSKNGRSIIMEKIMAEKKIGGCDCANKNPKGR